MVYQPIIFLTRIGLQLIVRGMNYFVFCMPHVTPNSVCKAIQTYKYIHSNGMHTNNNNNKLSIYLHQTNCIRIHRSYWISCATLSMYAFVCHLKLTNNNNNQTKYKQKEDTQKTSSFFQYNIPTFRSSKFISIVRDEYRTVVELLQMKILLEKLNTKKNCL